MICPNTGPKLMLSFHLLIHVVFKEIHQPHCVEAVYYFEHHLCCVGFIVLCCSPPCLTRTLFLKILSSLDTYLCLLNLPVLLVALWSHFLVSDSNTLSNCCENTWSHWTDDEEDVLPSLKGGTCKTNKFLKCVWGPTVKLALFSGCR